MAPGTPARDHRVSPNSTNPVRTCRRHHPRSSPPPVPRPPVRATRGSGGPDRGPAGSGGATGTDHGGGPRHRRLRGPVRRSPDTRVLAGVCGGLSKATGIDVTIVRIGFVLLTLGSGIGIPVYALAWLLIPLQGETTTIFTRSLNDRRGLRLVIALIPLLVAVQLVADELHIGFLDLVHLAGLSGPGRGHPHPPQRQRRRAAVDQRRPPPHAPPRRRPPSPMVTGPPDRRRGGHRRRRAPGPHPRPHLPGRPPTGRGCTAGHRRHRGGLRPLVALAGP